MAPPTLRLAQDPDADALLSNDPLALLMGMLLDQQFPLEWAFRAPWRLAQRMGRTSLDAAEIADYDPEAFVKLMAGPPALHRYPASMAVRVQALCRIVADRYGGARVTALNFAAIPLMSIIQVAGLAAVIACAISAIFSRTAAVPSPSAEMGELGSSARDRSAARGPRWGKT